ncbi:hypothetical protein [Planktothricoides raciborskii]|uniref:Uncharacterized protein n=1 Tax=Planktothricoides raciborskii GIHE-MW2 TaxID=2792601 RepID=A0AAU8JE84_9CYAN
MSDRPQKSDRPPKKRSPIKKAIAHQKSDRNLLVCFGWVSWRQPNLQATGDRCCSP